MKKYPKLHAFRELKSLMGEYNRIRTEEREDRMVAYVTSGAPVEVLEAAGVLTFFPENYGAQCGTMGKSTPLSMVSEGAGFPMDLCTYAKTHVGAILNPDSAPSGGLPKPDLLVCCNNICGTVVPWYQYLSRYYNCPLFILDVPFELPGNEEHGLRYIEAQIKDFIEWTERHTGKKIDEDKLLSIMSRSKETIDLWTELRLLGRHVPSPLQVQDLFMLMAPIVIMRGSEAPIPFYRNTIKEMQQRTEEGTGAVPEEKIRLIWDNIALWCDIMGLYRFFGEQDISLVTDTYTAAWSLPFTLDNPIFDLARVYRAPFINLTLDSRLEILKEQAREFNVHGLVMHGNRSCKPFSLAQPFTRKRFTAETGLPVLILEADMCDKRAYNPDQTRERISAFKEMLI